MAPSPLPRPPARASLDDPILAAVADVDLPAGVEEFADRYATVGQRDSFLWRWLALVFPAFRLSSVPTDQREQVLAAKIGLTMYVTVLDDLAERRVDRAAFTQASRAARPDVTPSPERAGENADAVRLAGDAWEFARERFESGPRAEDVRRQFEFDVHRTVAAMEYSLLASERPELLVAPEAEAAGLHNMAVFAYVDVDLAHSPGFDSSDLEALRRATWDAQRLARIGNWVTTWERELREGDASSAVVARAIDRGVVDRETIRADPEAAREHIRDAGLETELLAEWEAIRDDLREREFGTASVDLDAFVEGMIEVMEYHQASRGLK